MLVHGSILSFMGLLSLGAPPSTPSFAEAWYREVFDGNVALAAKEYESIYLAQPSERLTPRSQQKAAFRAGLCFERLGLPQSAVPAFLAASRADRQPADAQGSDAVLSTEAVLRLRSLQADTLTGLDGDEARLDFAVQGALELLKSTERARFACIANLEGAVLSRQRLNQARQEQLAHLGAQGAQLTFPSPAPEWVGESVLAGLREAASPEIDFSRWVSALRGRAATQALTALRGANFEQALQGLQRLSWLSSGQSEGADSTSKPFAEILRQTQGYRAWVLGARPVAARGVGRLCLDLAAERKASLCREIRARLDDASSAEGRGRSDLALRALERIRGVVDWSLSASREDPETRSLLGMAWIHEQYLVRSTASGEAMLRLAALLRGQADRILQLSETYMDELAEEMRLRGPALVEGRPDARDFLRSEVDRLLMRARSGVTAVDGAPAAFEPAAESSLLEADQLAAWAPTSIPAASRAALDSLLAAHVAFIDSRGAKKPETKSTK